MWVFALCLLGLALCAVPAGAASAHFVPYQGPFAYGLEVAPPWENGGTLVINFPEHLERFPDTQGILRHNDQHPNGHWVVAADGKSAVLDVDSATMAGVHVLGKATVVAPGRIELSVRIDNHSDRDMAGIIPLYCVHYRGLAGFPQWQENFRHTFVVMDGKFTALADIPTEKADAEVKAAYVRGCPQRDTEKFPREHGGMIERPMDRALTAVTSLDDTRAVLLSWTPGKTMLANAAIPCIHADPYYGPIPVGKSAEAKGVLVFSDEPLEQAVEKLVAEGAGAGAWRAR
jgi:hypothetical protein